MNRISFSKIWYTNPTTIRTRFAPLIMLYETVAFQKRKPPESVYRNPVIYARKLLDELTRDNLTRKQVADRYGVTSDRITQWLCLLKLPEEKLREIEELGDNWDRQLVTERQLRDLRRRR